MSEEKRRILELLSQGKVSVQEAERLLAAVEGEPTASKESGTPAEKTPRWLHVTVEKNDSSKPAVNIRVPLILVRSGMKLGALVSKMIPNAGQPQFVAGLRSGEPPSSYLQSILNRAQL